MTDFAKRYGTMAVIAGGSEGVGAAYAQELARRGLDLLLVARNPEPLAAVADTIGHACPGCDVVTLTLDLTGADAADRVVAHTVGREVGLLVYNAGASARSGNFVDGDLDFARRLLALNATTMMTLCHVYGAAMKARGRGGIVTTSSVAALVGTPGQAVYSGAKAFSTLFSEALWHELRPHGVHVLNHLLASTDTPAIARHYPHMAGQGDDPAVIVAQALAAIADGPVLRTAMGDMAAAMLAPMSRRDAVDTMYELGSAYRT